MQYLVIWTLVVSSLLIQNKCDCEPITLTIGAIASLLSICRNLHEMLKEEKNQIKNLSDTLLTNITGQLSHLEESIRGEFDKLEVNQNFREVIDATKMIEEFYRDMKSYNESITNAKATTKIRLESQQNLSHDRFRPIGLLREIYRCIESTEPNSILGSLKRKSQRGYLGTCLTKETENPIPKHLFDLLSMVVATELKVFLTAQMAAGILKIDNTDLNFINNDLEEKHASIMSRFKELLSSVSREVWRCDPKVHVEDVTYTKLNKVFQRFVANEASLIGHDACSRDCIGQYYQGATYCYSGKENLTAIALFEGGERQCTNQRRCNGGLWDCVSGFDIHLLDRLQIFPSADRNRRYDCIEINTPIRWTQWGSRCQSERVKFGKYKSNWYYVDLWSQGWFNKCDVCLCICDEYPSLEYRDDWHSERYFYVGPVVADTSNNYVVTGARIVKKDGIVFIQIQQGKLQNQYSVDASTVSWQAPPSNLHDPRFHIKMQWNGIRSIELKDTDVPHGHFLVGLRIGEIEASGIKRLRLEVYSLPVEYSNGFTVLSGTALLKTTSPPSKSNMDFWNQHVPDPYARSDSIVTGQYISFTTSSMEQDVGQTTLPLLDIQKVTTSTPIPMGGAGFYFKYYDAKKGYLGLKLKVYDFSQDLKVNKDYKHSNSK